MSTTSTPRSARFDLPAAPTHSTSTATDTGLAEWTSRIKAMQRQVDADDEAEQRRLEEEIVRARLARTRRSRTGQSGDFGVGMHGIDLSKLQDTPLRRTVETDSGTPEGVFERPLASTVSMSRSAMKQTSTGTQSAPISLAAFMGGNAAGPRLKRHEPQMDPSSAYDGRVDHGPVHPVFGRGGIAMPGMVAGGAPPSPSPSAPTAVPQPLPSKPALSTPPTVTSEPTRARTLSTSNLARRYVEKIEEQTSSQSPSHKPSSVGVRERRQSTPRGSVAELKVTPTPSLSSRPLSHSFGGGIVAPAKSPVTESRPKTPSAADIRPKTPIVSESRPKTPVVDVRARSVPVIEARSKTPSEFSTKIFVDELRSNTPGTDTTRAKTPIEYSPTRSSFSGAAPWQTPRHQPSPQLPSVSVVPQKSPRAPSPVRSTYAPQPQRGTSPGFLRLPNSPSKDPTPSISRLQGRGFVQSVVQASDRLSGDNHGSPSAASKHVFPSSSPAPGQGQGVGEVREKGGRRASVLDRWNPLMNANGSGTPSPPLPAAKSATPTRAPSAHASIRSGQDISVVKTHDTGRSVRSAVSTPAIPKTPQKKADVLHGQDTEDKLGSSSTMISYIKPSKTGDDPVIPDVDELGVKASEGGVQGGGAVTGAGGGGVNQVAGTGANALAGKAKTPRASASPLPSSPGKPLSHPTKDRAKKPRRARFEEGRPEDASGVKAPSGGSSVSGTEMVHPPNLGAHASSTGPAPSPPDTSNAHIPSSFGSGSAKTSPPSSAGRITDRWTEPTLIGVKPTSSAAIRPNPATKAAGTAGMVGRRALPGLAHPMAVVAAEKEKGNDEKTASRDMEERPVVPPSPTRHVRIPSTGNRASVMEVAQALNEAAQQQEKKNEREWENDNLGNEATAAPPGPVPILSPVPAPISYPSRQLPTSAGLSGPAAAGEKRKSSYERYLAIAMPPLVEERTPAVTPAHTMPRGMGQDVLVGNVASEDPLNSLRVGAAEGAAVQSPPSPTPSSKVHIDHVDQPLPKLDVMALLKTGRPTEFVPNPDLRMVSVEVMSVVHTNAAPVQRDTNIFYDAEVLVVVHRAKSRESGLVETKVWCWRGKKCHFGDKEERKVGELGRRYGTSADMVDQQREPAGLIHVLGGQLAIRQGSRAHWSSENTAMHVVRSNEGHVLIDEIDLNIRNLCSGYSYCISILDVIYVWHGCGSVAAERAAALRYAQGMAAKGTSVKELIESENDGDEMFWMVVGDSDAYAKADYWKWRSSVLPSEPRCWLVDIASSETLIRPVPTVFAETVQQESVYIIDCFWEFFVLVGKDARAKRSDITLAINTAMAMAPLVAVSKPFSPTVHVLILPTQLPLDMRHAFRDLDELSLNGGFIPNHMNILSTSEAIEHLRTSSWDRSALKDDTMLPLGLDSSHVPLQ